MAALCAPVELRHALVDAPGLNHPPISLIVTAFLAQNLGLGHGAELPLLLAHHDYLLDVFTVLTGNLQGLLQGLLPLTVGAYVTLLNRVWLTERPALWTKFYHFIERPFLNPIERDLNITYQI